MQKVQTRSPVLLITGNPLQFLTGHYPTQIDTHYLRPKMLEDLWKTHRGVWNSVNIARRGVGHVAERGRTRSRQGWDTEQSRKARRGKQGTKMKDGGVRRWKNGLILKHE